MGRQAAYTARLDDGREVGFGLVVRDTAGSYSAQFRGGPTYLIRSTRERSRPRAVAAAERIVRDHFRPPPTAADAARGTTWDDILTQLGTHLTADGARPATVRDYLDTIRQARSAAATPAGVDADAAQRWVNGYLSGTFSRAKPRDGREVKSDPRSPRSAHARVRKLNAIWSKYLVKRLRVAAGNPWAGVDLPKLDAPPVRTLAGDQVGEFFAWVEARWLGWPLPRLFWEVKAVTGCRLGDPCAVRSADLSGGKIRFRSADAKARRDRVAVLPADLSAALTAVAGPEFLWERYAADLPAYLKLRKVPTHRVNPAFDPERLCWCAKDEVDDFNKSHPDRPKIQSHDFRKRAVTEAYRAGLDVDTAAAAVGMSPATARAYYLAIDQEKASAEMSHRLADTLRPNRTPG